MDSKENKPDVSETSAAPTPAGNAPAGETSHEPVNDGTGTYSYYDDYGYEQNPDSAAVVEQSNLPAPAAESQPPATPPPAAPAGSKDKDDDEPDDGMLRMSFMEHLEELRQRILSALMGVGVAFASCIYFTPAIWSVLQEPFIKAMKANGVTDPHLIILTPTEAFSILWVKLPVLCSIFIASPWLLYQVWAFVAPGLYKHERRWAGPFIVGSAGLFILGGAFAYFIAFPLGLAFLLGIGQGMGVSAQITLSEYFDLLFNVTLGMGIVFELPILIFILSLLRIVTPRFLVRNSRYAILLIVIAAAIITPTPDVINLMLISVPMTLLYFTGVFASYVLYLGREGKRLPWLAILGVTSGILFLLFGSVYLLVSRYGYAVVPHWPFLVR